MAKLDDREIYEMSPGQLDDYLQSCSGLPVPPRDAPREVHDQWFVAYVFIVIHQGCVSPEVANARAVKALRQQERFNDLVPFIESALGHPLNQLSPMTERALSAPPKTCGSKASDSQPAA